MNCKTHGAIPELMIVCQQCVTERAERWVHQYALARFFAGFWSLQVTFNGDHLIPSMIRPARSLCGTHIVKTHKAEYRDLNLSNFQAEPQLFCKPCAEVVQRALTQFRSTEPQKERKSKHGKDSTGADRPHRDLERSGGAVPNS